MKMVCPSCGAIHSAEAWENDADARQCLGIVAKMNKAVAPVALSYLGFFRPASGRGLQWKKALRLIQELNSLAMAAEIGWKNNRVLQNRPEIWARAIERMIARPPSDLPLDSHNYLRAIAYSIAKEESVIIEKERNQAENDGTAQAARAAGYGESLSKDIGKSIYEDFKKGLKK
ncbi:hypothetical protein [Desulfatibacillum aliphaticivorans]|uniref:hypothetical protein n=1 Tax=Desulfatibacillum aliphaticivorans TaxID=218208 RepID=UPI0003FB0912|nr:hypothetical protein [Desulfatibacillum aliphaticivorans]